MLLGVCTACTGTLMGFVFAYAITRTPLPFKRFFRMTATFPIISPPFVVALSAILLFDSLLQKTATDLPLELILTETDSPALSPRPKQRRNEPAFLEATVYRLARLLKYPPEKIASITAANARRFYRLPRFGLLLKARLWKAACYAPRYSSPSYSNNPGLRGFSRGWCPSNFHGRMELHTRSVFVQSRLSEICLPSALRAALAYLKGDVKV